MQRKGLIIVAMAITVIAFLPTIASAHGHGRIAIGIGVGVPVYGGYDYWGGPYYYPYHPYYSRVVYAPPPPPVVVRRPVVVVAPATIVVRDNARPVAVVRDDAITSYVNVANSNGSITPVRIRRMGNVWVGPKGEQYLAYPTVEQLKPVYGF